MLTSQNVAAPCISFLCSTYRIICKPYHHHDTEENQHITHITEHGRKNEHFTVYLVQVSINNKGSTQLSFLCLLLLSQQLILHQFSCLVCSVLVGLAIWRQRVRVYTSQLPSVCWNSCIYFKRHTNSCSYWYLVQVKYH